jgi:dUTP pyrophosphatase
MSKIIQITCVKKKDSSYKISYNDTTVSAETSKELMDTLHIIAYTDQDFYTLAFDHYISEDVKKEAQWKYLSDFNKSYERGLKKDTFYVKCINPDAEQYYKNHSTYHEGDSGIDLFCVSTQTVDAHSTATIKFGIVCQTLSSYWLLPRSSISKTPLRMANSVGLIDKGYRGELMAKVDNRSDKPFVIDSGTRLFQICLPTLSEAKFQLTDYVTDTTRGTGGFGSTK